MPNHQRFTTRAAQLLCGLCVALPVCGLTLDQVSADGSTVVVFTNLASFNGTNGYLPMALMQTKDGNFYGTTSSGGTYSSGTVFQFTTNNGINSLVSLNGTNGSNPNSGVIQGSDGNFYGSAFSGGPYVNLDAFGAGFGTVFKVASNGALSVLAAFQGTNGSAPNGLVQAGNGIFYGTTKYGTPNQGAQTNFFNGYGGIFSVDTNHNLSNLFFFSSTAANGGYSAAPLAQTANGIFYGSTTYGGSASVGTVFELATNNAFTSLDSFGTANIYGQTNGYVPNNLVLGQDGNLYGTTQGSTLQYGTIFRLSPNGALTNLASFNTNTGYAPDFIMQAKDGSFLGTTTAGGTYNSGTVFQLTTNGTLLSLYSFTGTNDGYYASSLVQAADGSFYGTTQYGGSFSKGNIFKLSLVPSPNIQTIAASHGVLTMTWPAASGQNYQVQYKTNFTQPNWSALTNITAASSIGSVTDSIGAATQRFYRVVLVLQ